MFYIDIFSNRGVGCQQFVNGLYQTIGENKHHWFVSSELSIHPDSLREKDGWIFKEYSK